MSRLNRPLAHAVTPPRRRPINAAISSAPHSSPQRQPAEPLHTRVARSSSTLKQAQSIIASSLTPRQGQSEEEEEKERHRRTHQQEQVQHQQYPMHTQQQQPPPMHLDPYSYQMQPMQPYHQYPMPPPQYYAPYPMQHYPPPPAAIPLPTPPAAIATLPYSEPTQQHHHTQQQHDTAVDPSIEPVSPVDSSELSGPLLDDLLLLPEMQQHIKQLKQKWLQEYELKQKQALRKLKAQNTTTRNNNVKFADQDNSHHSTSEKSLRDVRTIEEGIEEETEENDESESKERTKHRSTKEPPTSSKSDTQQREVISPRPTQASILASAEKLIQLKSELEQAKTQHEIDASTITNLEQQLEHLRSNITESARAHATAQQEASTKLFDAQQKIELLEHTTLLNLRTELSTSQNECTNIHQQLSDAEKRLKANMERIATLEKQLDDAKQTVEEQAKELLTLRESDHTHTFTIATLEHEKSLLTASHTRLDEELKQLRHQHEDLKLSAMKHEKESEAKMREADRLHATKVAEYKAELDQTQLKHTHLQAEYQELQSRLNEQLTSAEQRLKEDEKNKHSQLQFIESLHTTLDQLTADAQKKEKENITLQSEMKSLLSAIDNIKSKHAAKLDSLLNELESKAQEVDDCKTLLKSMMHQQRVLKEEKIELTKQLTTKKEQLNHVRDEMKEEYMKASRATDEELKQATATIQQLEVERTQLLTKIKDHETHAQQLQSQLDELRQTPSASLDLHHSLQNLQDQLSIKDKILDSLQDQLSAANKSLHSSQLELAQTKKAQKDAERAMHELEEQRKELQYTIRTLQHDESDWTKLESELEEVRASLDTKTESLDRVTKQLQKKHDTLTYIENEISDMKLMFTRKELDAVQKVEKEKEDMQKECEKWKSEYQHAQQKVSELNHAYQDACNQVFQTEQELRILLGQLEKERNQRRQMKAQLQNLFPDL